MPIIEDLPISEDIRLIVWEISESINDLKTEVLLGEYSLKLLNQRKSEIQKKQFLAIRNILKELSIGDQDLLYDESGKPFIRDGQNISFSHSDMYAAVIIGKQMVGIDIEIKRDKILKIKEKFLGIELNYPGDLNSDKALIYWNIKESIFKTVVDSGIDFRKSILVLPLDLNNNYIKSWYLNDNQIDSYNSYYKVSKNYTLAYVIKG